MSLRRARSPEAPKITTVTGSSARIGAAATRSAVLRLTRTDIGDCAVMRFLLASATNDPLGSTTPAWCAAQGRVTLSGSTALRGGGARCAPSREVARCARHPAALRAATGTEAGATRSPSQVRTAVDLPDPRPYSAPPC